MGGGGTCTTTTQAAQLTRPLALPVTSTPSANLKVYCSTCRHPWACSTTLAFQACPRPPRYLAPVLQSCTLYLRARVAYLALPGLSRVPIVFLVFFFPFLAFNMPGCSLISHVFPSRPVLHAPILVTFFAFLLQEKEEYHITLGAFVFRILFILFTHVVSLISRRKFTFRLRRSLTSQGSLSLCLSSAPYTTGCPSSPCVPGQELAETSS